MMNRDSICRNLCGLVCINWCVEGEEMEDSRLRFLEDFRRSFSFCAAVLVQWILKKKEKKSLLAGDFFQRKKKNEGRVSYILQN